jgi:AsmA protein
VKLKNGKTNIDDLLEKDNGKPSGAQMKFDVASVRVEKAGLTYRDENSGAQYALKDINLKTGRIANDVPCKIDFAAVIQSSQPKLDMATQLKTTLTFDLEKLTYRLEGLDLQAKGVAPGIDNLAASLALPMLEGNAQSFKTSSLILGLDMKQPEQSFKVKLSSPVNGNLEIPQFNLSDLMVAVNATGDKLPNKSVSSEMKGSVQVDAARQSVQVNLAGGLLQSQVKAKVALNGFSNPAIRFDVDVDQLDADLYLPKKSESGSAKVNAVAAEQPMDLSALRKLNLDGSLRIGTLKVANIKSSQLHLGMKAHNGVLDINPLSANLYQGSMNGSATVNAVPAKPGFAINENLSGINIAPLLKDAVNFDTLEGKGNVSLNLNTQGDTVAALKQALNGNVALNLADGAVKGINIAKALRSAQGMLGKGGAAQTQAANKDEKTDFSELRASFKVNNGVAHNDDLSLKSPLLRLSGNGDINIGNDSINYLAKATLATTLQGQGGKDSVGGITVPVRLSGPFTDLKYTLDFGAMVSDAVKQKVQTEVKTKLQEQLKGGLKGLFK